MTAAATTATWTAIADPRVSFATISLRAVAVRMTLLVPAIWVSHTAAAATEAGSQPAPCSSQKVMPATIGPSMNEGSRRNAGSVRVRHRTRRAPAPPRATGRWRHSSRG